MTDKPSPFAKPSKAVVAAGTKLIAWYDAEGNILSGTPPEGAMGIACVATGPNSAQAIGVVVAGKDGKPVPFLNENRTEYTNYQPLPSPVPIALNNGVPVISAEDVNAARGWVPDIISGNKASTQDLKDRITVPQIEIWERGVLNFTTIEARRNRIGQFEYGVHAQSSQPPQVEYNITYMGQGESAFKASDDELVTRNITASRDPDNPLYINILTIDGKPAPKGMHIRSFEATTGGDFTNRMNSFGNNFDDEYKRALRHEEKHSAVLDKARDAAGGLSLSYADTTPPAGRMHTNAKPLDLNPDKGRWS